MPRPNWFIAFPIEGSFVSSLPDPPPNIRRFPDTDIHLTLTFLGGCSQEAAERALAALDERLRLARPAPIEVTLGEVVPMGSSRRHYTALSALLTRGRTETESLIAALRDPLSEAALGRREKRPPKAHVTLARPARRATEAQREAGLAWAASLALGAIDRTLDRIALYTWADDRPKHLFKIVAERALR